MDRAFGSAKSGVQVELYVRSLSPRESSHRLEAVVERLERLVATGAISHYRVVPTGDELPPTPADAVTDVGAYLLSRVVTFEKWATATGRSLDSLIERRSVFSQFTGEQHDAIVMPTMVMAEYDGGDLRFVAPCGESDGHVTVMERLDAIASDSAVWNDDAHPGAHAHEPDESSNEPTTPVD